MSIETVNPLEIFQNGSKALRGVKEDYEYRPQQEEMARAVIENLNRSGLTLIEAGTGVGKTLAYLIPLIDHALRNEVRVVVSTETRSLQMQIKEKDLLVVQRILDQKIHAEICFGASNYICKRKLRETLSRGDMDLQMAAHLDEFIEWESQSKSGLLLEYKGQISKKFSTAIARDPDECAGRKCPYNDESYYFLARERWNHADLLIVNHSLLCANIANESKLLPEFHHAVIDEAHRFPDIFAKTFQSTTDTEEIHFLFKHYGMSDSYPETEFMNLIMRDHLLFPGQRKRIIGAMEPEIIQSVIGGVNLLYGEIEEQIEAISSQQDNFEVTAEYMRLSVHKKRTQAIISILDSLARDHVPDTVRWIERGGGEGENPYSFFIAPLMTGSMIRSMFLESISSVLMTSATLTSGDFSYFKRSIGYGDGAQSGDDSERLQTLQLDSPFNYKKNVILHMPEGIPDPVQNEAEYHVTVARIIQELVEMTDGGAFVLFTSIRSLNHVHGLIKKGPFRWRIYSQTQMGPQAAFSAFIQERDSVLFGLATFWQGIDVPGEHLRLVIITKIPFRVPDEPVLEARTEMEKRLGRNPFMTLQLPEAILQIRQGFGRLIRTATDRGVVALLDPRLRTRSYGRDILKSMPATIRTTGAEVREAYRSLFS
jgi:ATP-dependent DNA helicase DinG